MGSFPGPEALEALEALRSVSFLAFGVVFLAGAAMGLAPSSYALYPVIAGYVAGGEERSTGRGLVLSSAFVLGTATVDAVLGALFGFLGGVVIEAVARYLALWNFLVAVLLALFALARGAPLRVVGASTGLFAELERFRRWTPKLERAAGWIFLAGALYFLVEAARVAAGTYL